jgi:DNA polymerase II small subunit
MKSGQIDNTENLRKLVQEVVSSGYHLDAEALEFLKAVQEEIQSSTVQEFISQLNNNPPSDGIISRTDVENVVFRLIRKQMHSKVHAQSVRTFTPFAKQIESQLEIVRDPSTEIGSKGTIEDFARYFKDRFTKLEQILRERPDSRHARTLSDAFNAKPNEKIKMIAMIVEKRERAGKIWLMVEDLEDSATVLVLRDRNREAFRAARYIPLDQVVCITATRSKGDLFLADEIILPDVPDRRPGHGSEKVYAALTSDLHIGSKMFLKDVFERFLQWLNGRVGDESQLEIAARVKYLIIAGDLVDGVGVYPRQEDELEISDVYKQYKLAAEFIRQIPDHIELIVIPGNHDPVRQALPQPPVPRHFAEPVYEARDVTVLGNPCEVRLHGVHFLLHHGRSLDDLVASMSSLTFRHPEKAMEYQLKCRHLAPEYGRHTLIAPERIDHLVISSVPDVFHSGHIHVTGIETYRGTQIVNSGSWQAQTSYMKRMGLQPTPGILPVLDLETLSVRLIDFTH